MAEVKGRIFKGKSFVNKSGFECWVSADDVDSLSRWQDVFGQSHESVFVFVYKIEMIDVDFDGHDIYESEGTRYAFFCIKLSDYKKYMKLRSPRWRTVNLPAEKFRQFAVPLQSIGF